MYPNKVDRPAARGIARVRFRALGEVIALKKHKKVDFCKMFSYENNAFLITSGKAIFVDGS